MARLACESGIALAHETVGDHRRHSALAQTAQVLLAVIARIGELLEESDVIELTPMTKFPVVRDLVDDTKSRQPYDVMHLVPPQSAPDWIAAGPLADPANPVRHDAAALKAVLTEVVS